MDEVNFPSNVDMYKQNMLLWNFDKSSQDKINISPSSLLPHVVYTLLPAGAVFSKTVIVVFIISTELSLKNNVEK
jgi:hypothetical protein